MKIAKIKHKRNVELLVQRNQHMAKLNRAAKKAGIDIDQKVSYARLMEHLLSIK